MLSLGFLSRIDCISKISELFKVSITNHFECASANLTNRWVSSEGTPGMLNMHEHASFALIVESPWIYTPLNLTGHALLLSLKARCESVGLRIYFEAKISEQEITEVSKCVCVRMYRWLYWYTCVYTNIPILQIDTAYNPRVSRSIAWEESVRFTVAVFDVESYIDCKAECSGLRQQYWWSSDVHWHIFEIQSKNGQQGHIP